MYAGPKNTRSGVQIYPGMVLGSEIGWLGQETTLFEEYSALILQEVVFKNLAYNISTFNFGTDIDVVDATASPLIDAIDPDLSAFRARGGKLINTQGSADPNNAPLWPLQFLEMVLQKTAMDEGGKAGEFIQVFMVPGGGHCGPLGTGYEHVPGTYDVLDALVPWVEEGVVPVEMLSTGPVDGTNVTRKLCSWPMNAKYVTGNINDWTSYICA